MAFRVEMARVARQDIRQATAFISRPSPFQAKRWLDGLESPIALLNELPLRHALIPEAEDLGRELRGFPYYSHRVIYEVDDSRKIVFIVRVYHSARKPLEQNDIYDVSPPH